MRRCLLHFHVWLARVGWALPAMLVSLGIAFVLLVWGATSERLAIAKAKVEIQKTNAQLSQPAKPPLSPQATAVRDLSAFYRSLGRYPSIEEPVGTLFRMASSAGLVLKQGKHPVNPS
ncbi:hypothetical protein BKK79_02125 [Cupriavidus sp. USMAA2-4]|uniref:hypothetical protein n=1 Tax=Cupriavidus sp. USMAA2-4 TaxID=876364 RepID=UPI0008A68231|nr:hypothetical protein [Cupriavidus sp. USMAA2-4]AOY90744.1 hypothetical protein BKK79_02125 [Cupriavidus sp. USMAA2-4]